jgi:hypothetical protein|tara:strand:- start:82 stop:279 length:198 start_codon:yes stop_codon:yes gene_type:complete
MLFIVQKNVLKKSNFILILIVTDKNYKQIKKNLVKEKIRSSRLKRLENQLKANILKRKKAKKNNG